MVLWLLRAGRDVSISDVDVAWIAPPYALLRSVPDADVLSGSGCFGVPCDTDPRVHQRLWHFHWRIGTDCLNVPYDADRSPRKSNVRNCGHQSGSTWSAWFNTGVMFFRARPAAVDMMEEWRDTMAEIKGEAQAEIDELPVLQNLPQGVARDVVGEDEWQAEMLNSLVIAILSGFLLVFAVLCCSTSG